jgi:germination protein M
VRVLERDRTSSSSLGRLVVMVALAVLAVGAISCGTSHPTATSTTKPPTISTTTATSSTTTATTPVATGFSLYFLRGNYLGVAHRSTPLTGAISASALSALVNGPDVAESAVGLSNAIPIGTKVLGLHTSSGTATVDFNDVFSTPGTPAAELDRVAQVVYTLTQFPSVNHVAFEIAGSTPNTYASGAVSLSQPL